MDVRGSLLDGALPFTSGPWQRGDRGTARTHWAELYRVHEHDAVRAHLFVARGGPRGLQQLLRERRGARGAGKATGGGGGGGVAARRHGAAPTVAVPTVTGVAAGTRTRRVPTARGAGVAAADAETGRDGRPALRSASAFAAAMPSEAGAGEETAGAAAAADVPAAAAGPSAAAVSAASAATLEAAAEAVRSGGGGGMVAKTMTNTRAHPYVGDASGMWCPPSGSGEEVYAGSGRLPSLAADAGEDDLSVYLRRETTSSLWAAQASELSMMPQHAGRARGKGKGKGKARGRAKGKARGHAVGKGKAGSRRLSTTSSSAFSRQMPSARPPSGSWTSTSNDDDGPSLPSSSSHSAISSLSSGAEFAPDTQSFIVDDSSS